MKEDKIEEPRVVSLETVVIGNTTYAVIRKDQFKLFDFQDVYLITYVQIVVTS